MVSADHWLQTDLHYSLTHKTAFCPSAMLRCGIFSSIRFRGRTKRPFLEKKTDIPGPETGVTLYQLWGWQLDQADNDVCLEIVRRASMLSASADGDRVTVVFESEEFLNAIQRNGASAGDRCWLHESITRMMTSSYACEIAPCNRYPDGLTVKFSILHPTATNLAAKKYSVDINTELAEIFGTGTTLLDLSERDQLRGQHLATWVHAYCTTWAHRPPRRNGIHADTILAWCGRENMTRRDRQLTELRAACTLAKKAGGWPVLKLTSNNMFVFNPKTHKGKSVAASAKSRWASAKIGPQSTYAELLEYGWYRLENETATALLLLMTDSERTRYTTCAGVWDCRYIGKRKMTPAKLALTIIGQRGEPADENDI